MIKKSVTVLNRIRKKLPMVSDCEIEKDTIEAVTQVRKHSTNRSIRIQYYVGLILFVILLIGAIFA